MSSLAASEGREASGGPKANFRGFCCRLVKRGRELNRARREESPKEADLSGCLLTGWVLGTFVRQKLPQGASFPNPSSPASCIISPRYHREVPSGFRQASEASRLALSSSRCGVTGGGTVDVSAHLILLLACCPYHGNRTDVRACC